MQTPAAAKLIKYVRDIACLPQSWAQESRVPIPRGEKRNMLAESGLIGKVEFDSEMSEDEVCVEIWKVFAVPMQLLVHQLAPGTQGFPFKYLQRTGAGSRSLCVPSVSPGFVWSGKQVATLAKSSGMIYILAQAPLLMKQVLYCT